MQPVEEQTAHGDEPALGVDALIPAASSAVARFQRFQQLGASALAQAITPSQSTARVLGQFRDSLTCASPIFQPSAILHTVVAIADRPKTASVRTLVPAATDQGRSYGESAFQIAAPSCFPTRSLFFTLRHALVSGCARRRVWHSVLKPKRNGGSLFRCFYRTPTQTNSLGCATKHPTLNIRFRRIQSSFVRKICRPP